MRKMILAMTACAALCGPAMAQSWRPQPHVRTQIRVDIQQLNNQIDRAAQRRTISFREASGLRREAMRVQRDYSRYARDGLDRREVAALQRSVNDVRQQLRLERRDWNDHRG